MGSIPGPGTTIPQAMQCGQEVNNVTLKQNYKNKSLKNTCKKVLTKCISEQAGDLTLVDKTMGLTPQSHKPCLASVLHLRTQKKETGEKRYSL